MRFVYKFVGQPRVCVCAVCVSVLLSMWYIYFKVFHRQTACVGMGV